MTQGSIDEAREVLEMMGSPDYEAELKEIVESIHLERSAKEEPLFRWKYRLPIFLAVSIGHVQPAFGYQRDSLLRERYFCGGRLQQPVRG